MSLLPLPPVSRVDPTAPRSKTGAEIGAGTEPETETKQRPIEKKNETEKKTPTEKKTENKPAKRAAQQNQVSVQ